MDFPGLELVPSATLVVDSTGCILAANSACVAALGYLPGELVGRPVDGVVLQAAPGVAECVLKDGTGRRYATTLTRAVFDGRPLTSITLGAEVLARPALSREQVERMASVGLLAAGLAHELNNALVPVVGNLYVVSQGLEAHGPAQVTEALRDAREAVERLQELVGDLRALSRDEGPTLASVDVTGALQVALRMTRNQFSGRALVVSEFEQTPRVDATVGRLCQVFVNLLLNAAQAVTGPGQFVRVCTRTDAQGHAVIEISDTGGGIPVEHQARIFEPFHTTRAPGQGTGLGLWICARIVTELHGTIELLSSTPEGTAFRVRLPPSKPVSASERALSVRAASWRR